tara:strand:- start:960 stop:1073 length:114 start_codon:yes stop_codon:yes gene_type:complete
MLAPICRKKAAEEEEEEEEEYGGKGVVQSYIFYMWCV